MSAREKAVAVVRDVLAGPALDSSPEALADAALNALEDSLLLVIAMPEPAHDFSITAGPIWTGDEYEVLARDDGSVAVSVTDSRAPIDIMLPPLVVAAISAAHIWAEDYRT